MRPPKWGVSSADAWPSRQDENVRVMAAEVFPIRGLRNESQLGPAPQGLAPSQIANIVTGWTGGWGNWW